MEMSSTPTFAPGCRLHPTQEVMLVPEGTLKLTGPSRDILLRVDGKRTVTEIADELLKGYPETDTDEIRNDILDLLARLEQRGVLRITQLPTPQ
jgi:pyrroloquinoline quinone biosynthesis protein D